MKVRCIKNKLEQVEKGLTKEKLKEIIRIDENIDLGFELGEEFVVYGITFNFSEFGMPFFYLCTTEGLFYPTPKANEFFEVIDPRPSQYWEYSPSKFEFNFPEWNSETYFYANLLDGVEREQSIFLKYKKLMDEEYDPRRVEENSLDENGVPMKNRRCRVCGNEKANFYPWGVEGSTPSYEICDCCGAQFGIEDCELSKIKQRRSEWISNGGMWCFPDSKPSDWTLERSIKKIPLKFE